MAAAPASCCSLVIRWRRSEVLLWAYSARVERRASRWASCAAANGIAAAQLAHLEALRSTLAEYAHNSTSDRRHLITKEQHEAGAAAIRLFGGSPDRDRTR